MNFAIPLQLWKTRRAALPENQALGSDGVLSERARRAFETAAREIERARLAETRATDLMSGIK
jgi:hypothetical protein